MVEYWPPLLTLSRARLSWLTWKFGFDEVMKGLVFFVFARVPI